MTTIADILDEHDTLCMDDANDRATLAEALRIGLVDELRLEAEEHSVTHAAYGMEVAIDHINGMDDDPRE